MPELTEQTIPENSAQMALDSRFNFQCGPCRECFNRCCSNVSILLSPYDVLRLKNGLGIDSSEFLEKYTLTMHSRERRIPVVLLRMDEQTNQCPFVTESGCRVYAQRPWACRMYPLGMAEPSGPHAAAQRMYFLVREDLCQGHHTTDERSVRDWVVNQGLEPYDQMLSPFLALMAHPGWGNADSLSQKQLEMYLMALYDLDRFRRFVFDTRFVELFDIDEARVQAVATDDEELLELAIDWLAFSLFHEKRMKLRHPVHMERGAKSDESCGVLG